MQQRPGIIGVGIGEMPFPVIRYSCHTRGISIGGMVITF